MRDPKHLLLGGNTNPRQEDGPAYVYNWREDHFIEASRRDEDGAGDGVAGRAVLATTA
jgi:hypothetical protein